MNATITAIAIGWSDDGRFAVLRQQSPGGTIFRWPDPDQRLENAATAVFTFKRGSGFEPLRAGSYVFFRGREHELTAWFDLMPALPPRVDIDISVQPSELREGLETDSP